MSDEGVFDAEHYGSAHPDGVQFHYWHLARNRVIERRLRALSPAPGNAIVEIGCGRGVVVEGLRRRGYEVIGIELGRPKPISDAAAPHIVTGQDVFELDDAQCEGVEIVLLLDVLEHVSDPADFLRRCKSKFASLRHVLVTMPARQELFSNYDEHYGHYLRYDDDTMAELARDADLELDHFEYFFHALYPPARILSALDRERNTTVTAPSRVSRILHRVIAACFAAEARLVPDGVPGTSLCAVLSVPG